MKKLKLFLGLFISAFMVVPFMEVNAKTVVTNEEDLQAALSGTDSEILLGADIKINGPLSVTKDVTIDGDDQWGITANYTSTNGNQTILTANPGATLTLKNIVLSNSPKYGVQAYNGGVVVLDQVRIQNSGYGAALINGGGKIIARGLTLWDNAYGIEFGLGDVATGTPTLVVDGQLDFTKQTKGDKLYVALEDNVTKVNVETTTNAPYQVSYENGVFSLTDTEGNAVASSNTLPDTVEVEVTNENKTDPEPTTPERPEEENKDEIKDEEVNPKTSDGIILTASALAISGIVAIIAKKKLA